jgi:signal transduction histidine kinase/CheY-like chemotaxis protein/tRNA A-37 threonylcarbamoyl transferase component Bud32/tetratricopeptide (TPR) repeat protein
MEGTLLAKKYRIIKLIGRGGMGVVWLAENIHTGEQAAIKVINEEYRNRNIDNLLRFKKEADILQGLNHPQIARLYEFDFSESTFFIAMEYVDGVNLEEFLRMKGRLDIPLFIDLARQLANVLSYIHDNHIVHGDIKPSNIILSREGEGYRLKILDFGVAFLLPVESCLFKRSLGSYAYMSPEQFGILKSNVDQRSDLYSAGIIFYQLLSGELPYKAASVYALMHRHIAMTPGSLTVMHADIPLILERVVFRLMQKEVENRYPNAASLEADLKEYELRLGRGEDQISFPLSVKGSGITAVVRFTGRERELAVLDMAYREACSKRGGVVLVTGTMGVGKTRLSEVFQERVIRSGGLAVTSDNYEYGSILPYGGILGCINQFLEIMTLFPRDRRDLMVAALKERIGDLGGLITGALPALKAFFPEPAAVGRMREEDEKIRFDDLLMGILGVLTGLDGGVVFVIDNLQWSDRATQEFLLAWSRRNPVGNLMLLCLSRDEPAEDSVMDHPLTRLKGSDRVTRLKLENLSRESVGVILKDVLSLDRIPEEGTEVLYQRTRGNIFFIKELIQVLQEKGQLGRLVDSAAANLQELPFSESIFAIIKESARKFSGPVRKILSTLAVMGKDFLLTDAFECFTQYEQGEFFDAVATARINNVLTVRGDKIVFPHDIIHRYFYELIPVEERRELHGQIARHYELQEGKREICFLLSHHYSLSSFNEKSVEFLIRAGKLALERSSHSDAAEYFTKALDRDAARTRRCEILLGLGKASSLTGDYRMAQECFAEAMTLTEDPSVLADIRMELGNTCIDAGEFDRAEGHLLDAVNLLGGKIPRLIIPGVQLELVRHLIHQRFPERFINLSIPLEDRDLNRKLKVYERLGFICFWRGKSFLLMYTHFKSLNLIDRLGPLPESLRVLCVHMALLISVPWPRPFLKAAKRGIWKFLGRGQLIHDTMPENRPSQTLFNAVKAGILFFDEGNVTESVEIIDRTAESYFREKTTLFIQEITSIFSQILEWVGQFSALEQLAARTGETGELYGNTNITAYSLTYRGIARHFTGDNEGARADLEESCRIFKEHKDTVFYIIAGKYLLRTLLRLDKAGEGELLRRQLLVSMKKGGMAHPAFSALYGYYPEIHLLKSVLMKKKVEPGIQARIKKMIGAFRNEVKGFPFLKSFDYRLMVLYFHTAGMPGKRDQWFHEGEVWFHNRPEDYNRGCLLYYYGLCLSREDNSQAALYLGRALPLLEASRAAVEAGEVRQLLSEITGYHPGSLPEFISSELKKYGDVSPAAGALRTAQELDAVIEIGKKINTIHDLDTLLGEILRQSLELVGAQQGELFLYQEDKPVSCNRISLGSADLIPACTGIVSRVDFTRQPLLVGSAVTDPVYKNDPEVLRYRMKSVVCLPLQNRDSQVGILYLGNHQVDNLFSEHELDLLNALAGQAAVAIENTILFRETRALQTRLSGIIESMPTGIISVDSSCRIIQSNRAAIRLLPALGLVAGTPLLGSAVPELARFQNTLEEVIRDGSVIELPDEPFGQRLYHLDFFPLIEDKVTGAVIKINDVTQQKKSQEQLIQVQKMEAVSTLVGGIAHDFNNSLSGILATVRYLKNFVLPTGKIPPREELDEHLTMVETSAERASDLVNQLLTISMKRDVELVPVDLCSSMRHVWKVCRMSFDKSIDFDFKLPAGESAVMADPVQIEQVFLNLLINASHAMTTMRPENVPWGGTLSVRIEPAATEDYWQVTVNDTGVGMIPEVREKIFEPFFTTKPPGKGTGLGLSMVYGIVRKLGGYVEVLSEPGHGTRFHLCLPVYRGGLAPSAAESDNKQPYRGEGTILIAEDERILATAMRKSLEACGFTVLEAADGAEAVEVFRKNHDRINIVVLDMVMPKQSGRQVFQEIVKIEPDAKVILTSGYRQDERVEELVKSGVRRFLQKPYSQQELLACLEELLSGD